MKRFIIFITLALSSKACYCQSSQIDLVNGKHITGISQTNINGSWNCDQCDEMLKLFFNKSESHVQKNGFNVYFESLIVTVKQFIYQGKNIKDKFGNPIELIISANDKRTYEGRYKDPITGTNIILTIHYDDEQHLTLSYRMPEMDVRNDQSKGTIFKKSYILVK